jgi:glycosyltransferase involved in cell wall biosynthesis
LLVPPRDEPALGAALERLIGDPALRHAYGTAGAARAASEFSLAGCLSKYEAVYHSLVGTGGA